MNESKYQIGNIITGCVTGIEKYGIFVSFDNNYSGLIHISEISDDFVRNINDYVNLGETIKVEVIGLNTNNHHLKLSIKNIDYRINKNSNCKIMETKSGFRTLKKMLNIWIDRKSADIYTQNTNISQKN